MPFDNCDIIIYGTSNNTFLSKEYTTHIAQHLIIGGYTMEILRSSKELSTEEKYFLTMSPEIEKMSNIKGQTISIDSWVIYTDNKSTDAEEGKTETILSIKTTLGEVFATNSATFIKEFERIIDLFKSDNMDVNFIKVAGGTSKSGREFITAVYANGLD